MQTIRITTFLRATLLADAATCAIMGLLMTLFSTSLSNLMALPSSLLFYAGLSLFPFSGFLLYVATRGKTAAPLVWVIVVGNALWTLGGILILPAGWVTPDVFGFCFVLLQSAGVAFLACLELIGLKRSESEAAPAFQRS